MKNKRMSTLTTTFPERITLELTNSCNLSCVFCPRKVMAKHMGFLDVALAERLLKEMADNAPVSIVPFFRGEPLLHPKWYDILSSIKKFGLGPIQLTTNATLMGAEEAQRLIDLEVDFVSFSLDTLDSQKYERARRGADYRKVIKNIQQLIQLKEKTQSRLPEIQVSAIDTEDYREGLDSFVAYWKPRVDRVRIYIEHSQDGHPGSIAHQLPEFDNRLPCKKVFTDMVILWDGEVALCNHDWTRDKMKRIGNVVESSISTVWKSERYERIRLMHTQGNVSAEPLCAHCDHWKMYYIPEGLLGKLYFRDEA